MLSSMAASQRSRSGGNAAAAVARSLVAPLQLPADDEDVVHPQHGAAALDDQEELGLGAEEEHRRGPWTVDEDLTLVNYIADHGEGRWNSLARAAGLNRTGKSCRLRWLNYLRPDVKRGNFTADEQLLILDLHSRWGNRWSKIAQHLPGRTDNEIKNYWRTKVQKHAKQLNCDANSAKFKDAMRYLWMPRLLAADHHHAAALLAGAHGYTPPTASGSTQLAAAASSMGYTCSSMVTSSSTTSESLATTSTTESYDGGDLFYAGVRAGEMLVDDGGGGGGWTTQQEASHGLWPYHQPSSHDNDGNGGGGGFQVVDPELTGWVQGFSDGLPDNLWSLDSMWKTQ